MGKKETRGYRPAPEGKDAVEISATALRPFPSAGLVLLLLCSPDLSLFCTCSHSALVASGRETKSPSGQREVLGGQPS